MEKTKNTKNTLLGRLPARLGTLAMAGVLLGVGGCVSVPPVDVAKVDKTGKGEMYANVDLIGKLDAKAMCERSPKADSDPRCVNPSAYDGVNVSPHSEGFVVTLIPVLVPKEVNVRGNDIIKIRMKDGVPAFYEGTFGRVTAGFQDTSQDCYWDKNVFGSGGIVCPKFNWSYKDLR